MSIKFKFIKSSQPKVGDFTPAKFNKPMDLSDIGDWRTQKCAQGLIENKVPFFPPTMSPADKIGNDLESLQWALDYYRNLGHEFVSLQKKMMGSRCVVVLRDTVENSFAVSKNGWIINHVDLDSEITRLHLLWTLSSDIRWDEVILDCELMPWSAMGKGLIDKHFYGYSDLHLSEIQAATKYGFEEAISSLSSLENEDYGKLNKKDYCEKYGQHIYTTIREFNKLSKNYIPLESHKEYIELFNASLSNYDQDYPPSIEPFQILRTSINGVHDTSYSSNLSWGKFRTDSTHLVVRTDNITDAEEFRQSLDINTTEGVVVKPLVAQRDQAPYLKVRNKEYLRIVYGPDYTDPNKYNKLLNRKYIGHKLRKSIEQWNACYDMLDGGDIEAGICGVLSKPEQNMDPRL